MKNMGQNDHILPTEHFSVGQLVRFNPKCRDFNLPPGRLDYSGNLHVNNFLYLRPYLTGPVPHAARADRLSVDATHYGLVIGVFPHGPPYSPPNVLNPNFPAIAVLFESGAAIVSPHYITKI